MKFLSILGLALLVVTSTTAYAGNCDYSWQHAKDGSRCGDRAADRQ